MPASSFAPGKPAIAFPLAKSVAAKHHGPMTSDDTAADEGSSLDAVDPASAGITNRLSLAHLFLWLTMASVLLAIDQRMHNWGQFRYGVGNEQMEASLRLRWQAIMVVRFVLVPAYAAAFS